MDVLSLSLAAMTSAFHLDLSLICSIVPPVIG
jgi:hypothetical protein